MFQSFQSQNNDIKNEHQRRKATQIRCTMDTWIIKEKEKKKFVSYEINIHNLFFKYSIEKRYSMFEQLDQNLKDEYSDVNWPQLPEKYYIHNFDENKIRLRMKKLEKFLNKILEIYSKHSYILLIPEFIHLKNNNVHSLIDLNKSNIHQMDTVTVQYIKLIYDNNKKTTENLNRLKKLIFRQEVSKEAVQLIIKGSKQLVSIFVIAFCGKAIYKNYLKKKPKFELTLKSKSFHEKFVEEEQIENFIEIDIDETHHICSQITSFIVDLFNFEKNHNAMAFLAALQNCDLKIFTTKYFQLHFNSSKKTQCKNNCFQILRIIQENNPIARKMLKVKEDQNQDFEDWLKQWTKNNIKDPKYNNKKPKLNMKEILFKNDFNFSYIFDTFNTFKEKNLLDTLIYDDQFKVLKISLKISKTQKQYLYDSITGFKWSKYTLKVESIDRKNSSNQLNIQPLKRIVNFYKKNDERTVYFQILKFYEFQKENQLIFLIEPVNSTEYDRNFIEKLIDLNNYDFLLDKQLNESRLHFGVFLSIEEQNNNDELFVSFILNFQFYGHEDKSDLEFMKLKLKDFYDYIQKLKNAN